MGSKSIWIFVAVVAVFSVALFIRPSATPLALPDALQAELIHATNFEALALNHVPIDEMADGARIGTNQIIDYVVLGGVQITNLDLRLKLLNAVFADIKYANHPPSACTLQPRHGIRCREGTNSILMAICYRCGDVIVEWNGRQDGYYVKEERQSPSSRQIFEQIFHDAGVKEDEN